MPFEADSTPASPTGFAELPPWPSGDGTSPTKRQSPQVRVLPGVLRSGLESGPQHGLISRSTPVQIRPPQLYGLEVLWPHAALVSAEDRVRPPAGPLWGCSSNRKTPPSQGGNRGAIPRRSTRAGGRKAVIRRPWEPESVGSTPTPLTGCLGLWSNGTTPAWRAGHAGSTPAGSTA